MLSTGSSSGAGSPGQGRDDLVVGETVSLEDTEVLNVGASYSWVFEDIPIGSSTILQNPLTATPFFIPDITGSYRVRVTVNGTDTAFEIFAVPLPNSGGRIPSFEEEEGYDEAGNMKGWHEAMTVFMRSVDSLLVSSSASSSPLPEKWHQIDVPASQTNVELTTLVSQTFNDIQAVKNGSITGLNVRLTGNVTLGQLTVTVTVNGTPGTLQVVITGGNSSGRNTQATGIDTYTAGDLIGLEITTDGSFAPANDLDVEAWVEVI